MKRNSIIQNQEPNFFFRNKGETMNQWKRSNAGFEYHRGWVSRGIQAPPSTHPHTSTHFTTVSSYMRVLDRFDSIIMDGKSGWIDRLTDGQTSRWTKPLVVS